MTVLKKTCEDRVLAKLTFAVKCGEIDKDYAELKPFVSLFDNIHIENDIIFHGHRIIVPTKQR